MKYSLHFLYARELQALLGYTEWRKFLGVIEKAKEACSNSGYVIADHFVEAAKMVQLGSGAEREIELSTFCVQLKVISSESKLTKIS